MAKSPGNEKTYWEWVPHPNWSEAAHVVRSNEDWDDLTYSRLMNGEEIDQLPTNWRLEVGQGPLEDRIIHYMDWLILSDRLVYHVWPLIVDCVQLFEPPVVEHCSGEKINGYKLVHVTRVEDCVIEALSIPRFDRQIGRRVGFEEYCVDPQRTNGANVFRYSDPPDFVNTCITCSNRFANALAGKGFTGLAFTRCLDLNQEQ